MAKTRTGGQSGKRGKLSHATNVKGIGKGFLDADFEQHQEAYYAHAEERRIQATQRKKVTLPRLKFMEGPEIKD